MRIGIRLAISGLVLASIIVTAVGVHVLWWRTADANSHTLAATINEQIVSAVEKELDSITTQARAAHTAIRTLFVENVLETREADKREFVFLSQLQAQPGISWVAFGWPDGAFFAAHKLGDLGLEMMEIAKVDGVVKRRVDQYQVVVGDIEFQKRRFENTDYKVTDQEWYQKGIVSNEPSWFEITSARQSVRGRRSLMPARLTFIKNARVCSPSLSRTHGSRNFSRSYRWESPARPSFWAVTAPSSRRRIRRRRSPYAARRSAAVAGGADGAQASRRLR